MEYFYRFRPTDALLGKRKELERQEIYFANPEELNDPMEGFKDLFWRGDRIVWKNFIRNYLLSLQLAVSVGSLAADDYSESTFPINVFVSEISLPTPKLQEIHRKIYSAFFEDPDIEVLPDFLASQNRNIRREELEFYLRVMHGRALASVIRVLVAEGLLLATNSAAWMPPPISIATSMKQMLQGMSRHECDDDAESEVGLQVLATARQLFKQIELHSYFQADTPRKRLWQMLSFGFPERYIKRLDKLIYSDWSTACFVAHPNDAAMWGNYGDGHKGVCLKFRAVRGVHGSPCLKLRGIIGWGAGPSGQYRTYGEVLHRFEEIKYANKFPEIDFFRSMGRIPIPVLHKDWYMDERGNVSSCADEIFSNEETWRQRYWDTFQTTVTSKFCDWSRESEYRLILYDVLGGRADPDDRKLTYDFAELAGIIFGINTSLDDRANITNIVAQKCKSVGRLDFELAQAFYSARTGKIEMHSYNINDPRNPSNSLLPVAY